MDNTMNVNVTEEQRQLTKEAFMVFSYGGAVEVETSPNVWVSVSQPLDFVRADKDRSVADNLDDFDFSDLTHNFRPKFPK